MRQIFLGLGIQNSSGLLAEPNGGLYAHHISKNWPHSYIEIPLKLGKKKIGFLKVAG